MTVPGRRALVLDVLFVIGVVLKGLDGLAELLSGAPLLFLTPGQLAATARAITAGELQEDPHDLIAHLILHSAAAATSGTVRFAAAYLIVHGAVKIAVVIGLVLGARRMYPWAIAVLVAFVVFQVAEIVVHPSAGLVALTALDLVVIMLTWREWRQRRTFRETLTEVAHRLRQRPQRSG